MATIFRASKNHSKFRLFLQRKSKFQKKFFAKNSPINGIVATKEDARIIIKALNTISNPPEALEEVFARFRKIERY